VLLSPGQHVLDVRYYRSGRNVREYSEKSAPVTIWAQRGHVYDLYLEIKRSLRYYIGRALFGDPDDSGRTRSLGSLINYGGRALFGLNGYKTKWEPCVQDVTDDSATRKWIERIDNAAKNDGVTPLMAASLNGDSEAVKLLLAAGADVNAANNSGATPLIMASQKGNAEAVKLLLAAGANVNYVAPNGATPLSIASEQGHADVVQLLKAAGAKE